jgi:hypothetical protein
MSCLATGSGSNPHRFPSNGLSRALLLRLGSVVGFKRGQDPLHRLQRLPEAKGANLRAYPVRPRVLGKRDAPNGPVARLGAGEKVRAAVVRVGPILGEAAVDEEVGDALYRLTGHAHPPPDLRDGVRLIEDAAHHLPPRGGDFTIGGKALGNIEETPVQPEGRHDHFRQQAALLRVRQRLGPWLSWRCLASPRQGNILSTW